MSSKGGAFVLGLDLSLTRAAAVLVPAPFSGNFAEVTVAIAGHGLHHESGERERDARCLDVAHTIEELAAGVRIAGAFVEGYAFSGAGRHGQPHALGELRAIVRRVLLARFGWAPVPVPASAARALFFGKMPRPPEGARRDWTKNFILASVRELGAPFKKDDEADAFLIANFGLAEVGSVALTIASTPEAVTKAVAAARHGRAKRATEASTNEGGGCAMKSRSAVRTRRMLSPSPAPHRPDV